MLNKKLLGLSLACLFISAGAFAYGGEAVIVYNPQTGAYGSYHGAPDFASADQQAQALCSGNCSVTTYVNNGWIALARNTQGNYGTGGVHDSEYDAEQSALNNCESSALKSGLPYGTCYVLRSVSSFIYSPDIDGVRPQS